MTIHLSPRQREVCVRVVRGDSDKDIAKELGIDASTVRNHVEGAAGRIRAVMPSIREPRPRRVIRAYYFEVCIAVAFPEPTERAA